MLFWCLILSLCVFVLGQYPEKPCDAETTTVNQIQSLESTNLSEMDPMVIVSEDSFNSNFLGLTIEEAIQQLPEAYNQTMTALFSQFSDPAYDDLILPAAIQGFMNSVNGSTIMIEGTDKPQILANTIFAIYSNLKLSCFREDGLDATSVALELTKPFLNETYQNELVESLIWIVVDYGEIHGVGPQIVSFLEPLIDILQATSQTQDVMNILVGLASQSLVSDTAEDILQSAGFKINTTAWGDMVSVFFEEVQAILDSSNINLAEVLLKAFEKIVLEIELGYI